MNYKIIDDTTKEIIATLKVRKNSRWGTVIDKVKEIVGARRLLPTGRIDCATGEADIKYVCFGDNRRIIRIEEC